MKINNIANNIKINYLEKKLIDSYKGDWNELSINYNGKFPEKFLEKYCNNVIWSSVLIKNNNYSEKFLEKIHSKVFSNNDEINCGHSSWYIILLNQKVSEKFLEKHVSEFNKEDFQIIGIFQKLSEKFIEKYFDYLHFPSIISSQKLSEKFIENHIDSMMKVYDVNGNDVFLNKQMHSLVDSHSNAHINLPWKLLSKQKLSIDFIKKYYFYLYIEYIIKYQKLSNDIICKILKEANIKYIKLIMQYQKVPVSLIDEYKDIFSNDVWDYICGFQKLSEKSIKKFRNYVNWKNISLFQKLSESFIHEYRNFLTWDIICKKQKMSEKFIESHLSFLDNNCWINLIDNQKLSEKFIKKYISKFDQFSFSDSPNLTESLIEDNLQMINWRCISNNNHIKLSEKFLEKYFNNFVDGMWENILLKQANELSEEFIEKHIKDICKTKFAWRLVSEHKKLSVNFIKKYSDKVYWPKILEKQDLSEF